MTEASDGWLVGQSVHILGLRPLAAFGYRHNVGGFGRVPSMFDSLGWKYPIQPDGGERLAKHKGVIARWRLKAVRSKTAT